MHSNLLLLLPMALLAASAAATAEPVKVFRRNPIPHASSGGPLDSPGGVLAFLSKRQNSVACDAPDADQCGNGRTDCCRFYNNGATGGCCFSGCCGTQDTCDPAATQELGACICVGTEAECGGGGGAFTGTMTATETEGAASTMMMSEAPTSTDADAAAATDSMMPSASSEADAATPAATTASSGPSASASASAGAGGGSSGAGKNVGAVTGLGLVMAAVGFAAAML